MQWSRHTVYMLHAHPCHLPLKPQPIYSLQHILTLLWFMSHLGPLSNVRGQEGETSIFGPNLFVPTIYLNVGYKGGGQIWTIRREGVTSRQVSPPPSPADDSGVLCVASDEPFLTCTITFASALSAVTYVCSVSAVPAVP